MIEMASLGAKVLQIRSVRFAMRYGVPIHVRSSFHEGEGTWVVPEEEVMEGLVVSGVTYNRNEAKIRMRGVKDVPGVAARVFSPLSGAGIVVDMIIQNLSHDGSTDMTFTVPRDDYERALEITRATGAELGSGEVEGDTGIAKISIVGLGMKDHAGVATRMFAVLAGEGINIQLISTSEIKVSVVIEEKYTELAVRALHAAFVEAPKPDAAPPRAERALARRWTRGGPGAAQRSSGPAGVRAALPGSASHVAAVAAPLSVALRARGEGSPQPGGGLRARARWPSRARPRPPTLRSADRPEPCGPDDARDAARHRPRARRGDPARAGEALVPERRGTAARAGDRTGDAAPHRPAAGRGSFRGAPERQNR
jgi:predicted amino acid-binding ACT domain protein